MGSNPSRFSRFGLDCPVERVSWNDVQEFVSELNRLEAERGNEYRLPTEAEWEYAARAGSTGDRFVLDLEAIAWYYKNSGHRTNPVGQKLPNAFGLHDMMGNVWEWVQDWYGQYSGGDFTDPTGPLRGSVRVIRGGSWFDIASECQLSSRGWFDPGLCNMHLGFRVVRTGTTTNTSRSKKGSRN